MLPAGKSLRTLREKLGLTMRDVENSSARLAERYRNEEFSIPPSGLSDIETKGILPSIYRLYTLSVIYRRDLRELMSWYGVDMNNMAADLGLVAPPKSHLSNALAGLASVQVPVRMDPGFDESAPPISDEWSSNGDWCRSPIWHNSRTAISRTATSVPRISLCIRFCLRAVSFRSMSRETGSSKDRGVRNTNVRFILWKPGTDILAAGAACAGTRSFCSRILYRRYRCAYCVIRRKPKCSVKWWGWL